MSDGPGAVAFLTNHGHVLLALHRNPDLLQREIAEEVGITEGRVNGILHDLQTAGYVTVERVGRRNHYVIDADRPLRHPLEANHRVAEILLRHDPPEVDERSTAA